MDRNAPIILLIEDDEFDRMTLTRMLEESGYGVIAANRGAAAVDTFAINHQRIALVLASTGLSDVERIRLDEALYRIDPFVPVIIAARRASHRPNSGEDSGRASLFAALIVEVQRQLHKASARAEAQAQSFAEVQAPAPVPASVEGLHDSAPHADADGTTNRRDVFFPDIPDVPLLVWTGSSQLTSFDPRSYLTRLSNARRTRWKRVRRLGMVVAAAGCAPLIVPPLLELQPKIVRAIEQYAPATAPPLASASISARIGIVPLVSSTHVKRSRLADGLGATLRAGSDSAAPPAQPKRSRNVDSDRFNQR